MFQSRNAFQQYLDLQQPNIDVELFEAALSLQYVQGLIMYGGSTCNRPEDDDALSPEMLLAFIRRAVIRSQQTHHFEKGWLVLQEQMLAIHAAWQCGIDTFQEHLLRATASSPDELEYLSDGTFATDCYANVAAKSRYSSNQALQAWFVNGYMKSWSKQFDTEE